jgi:hypothetical protein
MGVDKCSALHNKIIKHGWLGACKTIEDFRQDCKTWFNHFGDAAEALRDTLSPDLVTFLESAYMTDTDHSFFYYVGGLDAPNKLFEAAEFSSVAYSDDDPIPYIALCAMNDFAMLHGQSGHDRASEGCTPVASCRKIESR